MKKRLLMILGAGASVESGMPRVADIDALILNWAPQAAAGPAHDAPDYYTWIWEALGLHLAQGPGANRATPNFERALSDLAALMHWARPPPEGGALRALVGDDLSSRGLEGSNAKPYQLYIDAKTQLCALLEALGPAHTPGIGDARSDVAGAGAMAGAAGGLARPFRYGDLHAQL